LEKLIIGQKNKKKESKTLFVYAYNTVHEPLIRKQHNNIKLCLSKSQYMNTQEETNKEYKRDNNNETTTNDYR
jgi:hypothetical protein